MLKQERRHAPSGNLIFLLLFVWNELFEMAKELVTGCGVEPRNTKSACAQSIGPRLPTTTPQVNIGYRTVYLSRVVHHH